MEVIPGGRGGDIPVDGIKDGFAVFAMFCRGEVSADGALDLLDRMQGRDIANLPGHGVPAYVVSDSEVKKLPSGCPDLRKVVRYYDRMRAQVSNLVGIRKPPADPVAESMSMAGIRPDEPIDGFQTHRDVVDRFTSNGSDGLLDFGAAVRILGEFEARDVAYLRAFGKVPGYVALDPDVATINDCENAIREEFRNARARVTNHHDSIAMEKKHPAMGPTCRNLPQNVVKLNPEWRRPLKR